MRRFLIVALMILPLVVVGCSKGPAEAALKAADEAIAKVKPEAEKFVPEQFKALTDAAAAAKANFDKGDYASALAAAKDLPAKATEVMTAAAAKKDELVGQWTEMGKVIPAKMLDVTEKVNSLAAMKKLPVGIDAAKIDEVKARLVDMNGTWAKATEAFGAGDIKGALEMAGNVKTSAEWLQTSYDAIMPKPATK
ncbi:MAG: hypothetical protein NTY02_04160 [Acidobacteria bacterium]|nr:hypothetical protein [Acidobacteriota bacterium]